MKTKWGGCNHRAGNIRLNTELVKKPKDLLEYVVVHELAHRRQQNHSKAFWLLVAQYYPEYKAARAWLRANSSLLRPEDTL